jgi:hypothetical protein
MHHFQPGYIVALTARRGKRQVQGYSVLHATSTLQVEYGTQSDTRDQDTKFTAMIACRETIQQVAHTLVRYCHRHTKFTNTWGVHRS